jgi:signal transduction histidine kinase
MTSNNSIALDSLHRFIDALAPTITELLNMASRLADQPDGFDHATAAHLQDAAERLLTIQTEFKTMVALESGAIELHPQTVPLQTLCKQVEDLLIDHAQDLGIELAVHVPADLTVYLDPALCEQVIRRLVSNALRYNHAGGKVCLSAKALDSGGVVLRVTDSGLGLARAHRELLFKPFERLGKELCSDDGIGMGLAIAQRMAHCLGARLSVRSRLGHGSIFRLHLPGGYP